MEDRSSNASWAGANGCFLVSSDYACRSRGRVLRNLIADESDFDQLRGNPQFERLTVGPAPLA